MLRAAARLLTLALAAGLFACAKPAPPPPPVPVVVGDLDAKGAAQQIATDFSQQLGAVPMARTIVIDNVIERASGQQTGVSVRLESELGPAISATIKSSTLLKFDGANAAQARYVVTGTVAAGDAPNHYTLTASLTDRQSGLVVAQSAARFVESGLDASPTRFYNESPSLVRDRSVDGYVRTSETPAGRAADALYVSQLPTSALLAEALEAYNAGKWDDALAGYTAAALRPEGQQLRTFNGIYLSNERLGHASGAEAAFGHIAALGLATNNLSVKLLFKASSATDFWPGPDFSGVYPMWIRQLARAMQAQGSCLNIVGNTSRSGSEAVNDALSVQRAETVKKLLVAEVRTLSPRLRSSGVGYRENIIGTGSDDARDALDRRVEFKVVECPH